MEKAFGLFYFKISRARKVVINRCKEMLVLIVDICYMRCMYLTSFRG